MSAANAARSFLRSAAARTASTAARAARSASKPNPARSAFRISAQKPVAPRIFRSPVELSTMLPYHTATASALLTSMLSVSPRTYGWTLEDSNDDV